MKSYSLNFLVCLSISATASWALATEAEIKKEIKALCPAYSFSKEANLNSLNPPAKIERGVTLPGTGQTLFRGAYEANPQFDYQRVLLGLMGQDNWIMGSPMHWGITQVLTGARTSANSFLPTGGLPLAMSEYFKVRNIQTEMASLLACVSPKFYSLDQSNVLARDLMNKSFNGMSRDQLETRFFNIKDPAYYTDAVGQYGLGNNAVDFVISTYNDQIASLYGKKILVFKDTKNRSIDLGYWNFVKNGIFWTDWVDNGEINTPGYITNEDLVGYQHRRLDRSGTGWGTAESNNPIVFAFYKMNFKGTDFIAVVDGAGELCMVQDDKSQKISYCKDNWSGKIMQSIVPANSSRGDSFKNRAGLMGIVLSCESKCTVPAGLFEWYQKTSNTELPADVQATINQLKVNGKKSLQYVKAPAVTPPAEELPGVIKVISATYATATEGKNAQGNVTAAAAKFCDTKEKVTYKVSSRFLDIKDPETARSFILEYTCSNKPKTVRQKKVDPPAENKIFSIDCSED